MCFELVLFKFYLFLIGNSLFFWIESFSFVHKNIFAYFYMLFKCIFIKFSSTWGAFFKILIWRDSTRWNTTKSLVHLWSLIVSLVLKHLPVGVFYLTFLSWRNNIVRIIKSRLGCFSIVIVFIWLLSMFYYSFLFFFLSLFLGLVITWHCILAS